VLAEEEVDGGFGRSDETLTIAKTQQARSAKG
jgi:hypothetical protein